MITKFLRWLFSPRASLGYDEHEDDDWRQLEDMGYAVLWSSVWKNKYCFTDNGVRASEWFKGDYEDMQRNRRVWSVKELERVLKLESEK